MIDDADNDVIPRGTPGQRGRGAAHPAAHLLGNPERRPNALLPAGFPSHCAASCLDPGHFSLLYATFIPSSVDDESDDANRLLNLKRTSFSVAAHFPIVPPSLAPAPLCSRTFGRPLRPARQDQGKSRSTRARPAARHSPPTPTSHSFLPHLRPRLFIPASLQLRGV